MAGGRPTKYTKATVARIVEAISKGATYELAAAYGGISYQTFNEWSHDKPEFSEAVKAAEGKATARWLDMIERAAQEGSWQAAAWKLERRYPQMYGRTVSEQQGKLTHEHSGPGGQPIQIQQFNADAVLAEAADGSGADRDDA